MEADEVRALYDPGYAAMYEERFLLHGWSRHNAEFEVELLGQLLDRDASRAKAPRWLDVGCGSGWFLSRFRGVDRSGLDLSPAMLDIARRNSPDAELREGSFLDRHDDWTGHWDVVSCMWFAYCYAGTLDRVEQVLDNLSRWTATGGAVFLPVCDFELLAGGRSVPYENKDIGVFGGPLQITSVTWDWTDEVGGKRHEHLVAPHIDHVARRLRPHFDSVSYVTYPRFEPDAVPRRALLATGKRAEAAATRAAEPRGAPLTSPAVVRRRSRYWRRRLARRLGR
ncbi:MAG: hypothetical protein QOI95_2490 [Acidimicrobiaceae bacterium]